MNKNTEPVDLSKNAPVEGRRVAGFRPSFLPKMFAKRKGDDRENKRALTLKVDCISSSIVVDLKIDASYTFTHGTSLVSNNRYVTVRFFLANLSDLPPIIAHPKDLFPVRFESSQAVPMMVRCISAVILKTAKDWEFRKTSRGVWISATVLGRKRKCFVRDVSF